MTQPFHPWVYIWKKTKTLILKDSCTLKFRAAIFTADKPRALLSHSVPFNSLPWTYHGSSIHEDFPGQNTGVGCHALLQGIFPTQGSNPGLPHCRWIP